MSLVREASNVTTYETAFFHRFQPNTAMDMVGRLPGFAFDGGSSARGFSGTGGNVLIDGERPPSRGDGLSAVISRIPASAVARIEIIRGGAEGIDMQGRPIIANIIRKPDASVSGAVRTWADAGERGNVSGGGMVQMRRQSGGQLIEGEIEAFRRRGTGDEFRRRVTPDGNVLLIGDKDLNSQHDHLELTGAWESDALGGRLRINGLAASQAWSHNHLDALLIPGGSEASQGQSDEVSGEFGVRYTRTLGGGERMELVAFQSFSDYQRASTYDTPTFTSGDAAERSSGESILRFTVGLPTSGAWAFDGGAEGVFNFRDSSGDRVYNGQPYLLAGDQNRIEELRGEAFGAATWNPVSNLSLESGLRYEWSRIDAVVGAEESQKELGYLKPRLNVSWAPERGHQLGLQVERAVGQLDFGGFASAVDFNESINGVGNVGIEPEKFWILDARYERQFGGQTSLVLNYVQRRTEDILGRAVLETPPATPGGTPTYVEITRNLDEAVRETLAVDARIELDQIGMPGGILGLGVDLADSSINDPVTGVERQYSGQNAWGWNMSLQQTLTAGDFRWSISAKDAADSTAYSPYSVTDQRRGPQVNASIAWKPAQGWTLGASANNLAAEPAHYDKIMYTAPRSVGTPAYTEYKTVEQFRTVHVSVRRDF